MTKKCKICDNEFRFSKGRREIFCSRRCLFIFRRGINHSTWKGGKPECSDCGKKLKGTYSKRCLSCAAKARIMSSEHKKNLSLSAKGKKKAWQKGNLNHFWKGGVTPIHKALRGSLEYEAWRKSIFERDLYTCQRCGQIGGYLQADHIKRFSDYPELRLELNNGETLCIDCHKIKTSVENKIYWKNQFSS